VQTVVYKHSSRETEQPTALVLVKGMAEQSSRPGKSRSTYRRRVVINGARLLGCTARETEPSAYGYDCDIIQLSARQDMVQSIAEGARWAETKEETG
jgi:hypothetical protein